MMKMIIFTMSMMSMAKNPITVETVIVTAVTHQALCHGNNFNASLPSTTRPESVTKRGIFLRQHFMFELSATTVVEIIGLLALRWYIKNHFEQLNGARKRAKLKSRLRAI